MPIFEGFWINPDGKFIKVFEHYGYIKEHPKQFGFTEKEMLGFEYKYQMKARDTALITAMKREWIRVRQKDNYYVFEAYGYDPWVLTRIRMFADKTKMWDSDRITINDISTNRGLDTNVGVLRSPAILDMSPNPGRRKKTHWRFESVLHSVRKREENRKRIAMWRKKGERKC